MPNFESTEDTKNVQKVENDNPLKGTAEMLGVKPEEVRENGAEAPETSYKDIGEQRLAAAAERVRGFGSKTWGFMKRGVDKIKSWGSSAKEAGKTALHYTLAAPEMIRDAGTAVSEKIDSGAEYISNKMDQGSEYITEKGKEAYQFGKDTVHAAAGRAFEEAVYAGDQIKEGVVYVSDKAKEGYEKTINYGKEKYASLRERAGDARAVFGAAVQEARRRKQERRAKSMENHPEYVSAFTKALDAERHLQQVKMRLRMAI